VFAGAGEVTVNGRTFTVDHPGCYPLIEHDRHTTGQLDLRIGEGVRCDGVCFLPGLIG
jgi:hypothetical protein